MENDAMSVVPPKSAILLPPSTTTSPLLLLSTSDVPPPSSGSTDNTNIIEYAAIPKADNGTLMPPKCNDAYGPCSTSLHDDDPPFSVAEHNAPTRVDAVPPDAEYCILS